MEGSTNKQIMVQVCLDIKQDPILKIINSKRAGNVAEVIEPLPSKH
jgi:hypothetical protein